VDFAWKQRILKGLKVYSEAEQHRRFKIAYDNRKAWIDNRKHFTGIHLFIYFFFSFRPTDKRFQPCIFSTPILRNFFVSNYYYIFSLEKISGCIKKWATGKSRWTFCNDWPTRSQCMKLIKPERGSGVLVEQPLVPIKIIEHVNHPPQLSTESTVRKESFMHLRFLVS
jgi:hypothetical protein